MAKAAALRHTVNSLITSIPKLINALFLNLLFIYIFSILGVQLLSGKMSYCGGLDQLELEEKCITNKTSCLANNGTWNITRSHYNNLFIAMLTFFEVESMEGWEEVAFEATNSGDVVDLTPHPLSKPYLILIFIIFLFVTTFFMLNVLITILITGYQF